MNTSLIIKNIEIRLKEIGMSKAEFYKKSGVSSATYSQWNTGMFKPSRRKLESVAKTLGVSVLYLTTEKEMREKFQQDIDKTKAFEQQLKAFGWECEFLDCQDWYLIDNKINPDENGRVIGCEHSDGKNYKCKTCPYRQPHYRFSSNGNNIAFNVSPSDYTSFCNDVEKFYKQRIQKLLHTAFQGTSEDRDYLIAAHEDSAGATPEQKQHADEIMMDDKEWK